MISTNEFKKGISIVVEGTLYQVIEFQHIKPGKGGAFVRTRLKNMRTKNLIDKTFRAGEKVEGAFIENKKLQYMYNSHETYFFLCADTFEELSVPGSTIGDKKKFLKEGMEIVALSHKGNIFDISLPVFIDLKVKNTEPGVRGDTAKAAYKPAELETGAFVQVPLFINTGDTIRIDTRSEEYVART